VASHTRLIEQRDAKSMLPGHHSPPVARKTLTRASPRMRQLPGHSQDLDAYVTHIAARNRSAATRHRQRLLSTNRN
jgi:hypothetical protein